MNPITFNFTGAIQNYTVPVTGTYDLSAFGAGGGSGASGAGGSGAGIGATFTLMQGQQLQIVVGGAGVSSNNGGGGGGFTEIFANSGAGSPYSLLLVAGGGGGSGSGFGTAGQNASIGNPGAGTGAVSNVNGVGSGGGGAGALSAGGNGTVGGQGFAAGGSTSPSYAGGTGPVAGGYGGGGAAYGGGGGGGGYTGGTGGNGFNFAGPINTGGNGGTSYISNTGVQNFQETIAGANGNRGNGSATVRLVAAAPCYVTGTRIRVLRGRTIQDVPVERLRVGDLAITASGRPRPIRWIGTRAYLGLTAPKHDRPVRIRAGALADGVPARDLHVSPDHCLSLDGLFVAAGHLINGTSITRGAAVRDLTYWHVELDSHDLLMAENTPAESFLAAQGVRAGFDGVGADDTAKTPVAYAPRAERHTPGMDALRERLILRAGLSTTSTRFGAVRAWLDVCDGARVAGWAQDAAHPDAPVCLDILVDGLVVAMALAQDHRADLAAAGMGDGRHGFDIALDAPLPAGIAHTVEVRRSADGLRVAAMAVDAAGAWTALLAA